MAHKFVKKEYVNTRSNVIQITEDKLDNILMKHLECCKTSKSWLTPFTLLITVILVLSTAEFKDSFNVDSEVWTAIFMILTVVFTIWLIITLINVIKNWNKTSIKSLIERIKNSED